MIAFSRKATSTENLGEIINELREEGFVRLIAAGRTWNLSTGESPSIEAFPAELLNAVGPVVSSNFSHITMLVGG